MLRDVVLVRKRGIGRHVGEVANGARSTCLPSLACFAGRVCRRTVWAYVFYACVRARRVRAPARAPVRARAYLVQVKHTRIHTHTHVRARARVHASVSRVFLYGEIALRRVAMVSTRPFGLDIFRAFFLRERNEHGHTNGEKGSSLFI